MPVKRSRIRSVSDRGHRRDDSAALPEIVADMVRIQRLTSARPGEICSMAPADMDHDGRCVDLSPGRIQNRAF